MNRISIALPVPIYLKKILTTRFGEKYAAKEDNWFGILIINVLQRKSDRRYEYKKNAEGEVYVITIAYEKARDKGFGINEIKAKAIIRSITRNFREELYYQAVMNNIHYGIDYKTSIQNILDSYDILEEELSYETLRKDFNRKKEQIINKING